MPELVKIINLGMEYYLQIHQERGDNESFERETFEGISQKGLGKEEKKKETKKNERGRKETLGEIFSIHCVDKNTHKDFARTFNSFT